ncbi:serine/threonine-protein kinase [Teredinibacter sp. KSP-S5-2]|uniref:serine/threonine-protein kinase n=1 Tax=Teredinibacter sp. KSP-S5-2 TaxID=3034506 RepID=UPI002934E8BE|nr:serine/threonine-protein kinase [Teredinibacter sp. KSP-S5-2]WNO09060.1 serine/threonine-protein kinase [Teredinibacter sp. KSP-S5-2]
MNFTGYQVDEQIGHGGMATIYKGQQLSLQRPVAIKVLQKKLVKHQEIRTLFERESFIIAKLDHPNIINVIDQGITKNGQPYFVMNYVKGVDLDVVMRKGNVQMNASLDLFAQVAKALSYAHKNGIVHRDIKPSNILLDGEGTVRILDFGIAQLYRDFGQGIPNEDNMIMGTNSYLAPEMLESAANATHKSDIYSLGVVMYQFYTGQLPGQNPVNPRYLNSSLSPTLTELILRCLAKAPKDRPDNVDEIKHCLLTELKGKHLNEEQRKRAHSGVKKQFQLLDIIKEDLHSSVYLFSEKTTKKAIVIKKAPLAEKGYEQAKKLSQIRHRNIIDIYGTSKNDRVFILVMEYCTGGTLAERLTRPFALNKFLSIATDVCSALAYTHDNGLVHGNLRPSNILFQDNGVIKVSDFGFIRHYEQCSQEQNWYSIDNEDASVSADIYSAGVIFHQLLTAKLPQRKHLRFTPDETFTNLPEGIQSVIKKMLSLDPQKRFRSFHDINEELEPFLDDEQTLVLDKNAIAFDSLNTPEEIDERQPTSKNHPRYILWLSLIATSVFATYFYVQYPELIQKITESFIRLVSQLQD